MKWGTWVDHTHTHRDHWILNRVHNQGGGVGGDGVRRGFGRGTHRKQEGRGGSRGVSMYDVTTDTHSRVRRKNPCPSSQPATCLSREEDREGCVAQLLRHPAWCASSCGAWRCIGCRCPTCTQTTWEEGGFAWPSCPASSSGAESCGIP